MSELVRFNIDNDTVEIPIIEYNGVRVLTTDQVATFYNTKPVNININKRNHKDKFIENKHYFYFENEECVTILKQLNDICLLQPEKNINQITRLTLWTEPGVLRLAKILNTEPAWNVFEILEENYFRMRSNFSLDKNREQPLKEELIEIIDKKIEENNSRIISLVIEALTPIFKSIEGAILQVNKSQYQKFEKVLELIPKIVETKSEIKQIPPPQKEQPKDIDIKYIYRNHKNEINTLVLKLGLRSFKEVLDLLKPIDPVHKRKLGIVWFNSYLFKKGILDNYNRVVEHFEDLGLLKQYIKVIHYENGNTGRIPEKPYFTKYGFSEMRKLLQKEGYIR
jgi:hypothetical protein